MVRKLLIGWAFFLCAADARSQTTDSVSVDTTVVDYDELFSELDALIDSLTAPRSFTIAGVGVANGFFTYTHENLTSSTAQRQMVYSPSVTHYNKRGWGGGAGASVTADGSGLNAYQFSVWGSYDYIKNRKFITGVSLLRYFTKGDLPFYLSPLETEAYGYFTYRKPWLRPSVAVSYGWGSRRAYEEREEQIRNIRGVRGATTNVTTDERIVDFNVTASLRHDFYFLKIFSSKDFFRLTPQVALTSGTQQFGFNQTSNSYATLRRNGRSVLYNSENVTLDNSLNFQPLSLTAFLRSEYSTGKFFVQPQAWFDYYFPATTGGASVSFAVTAGVFL